MILASFLALPAHAIEEKAAAGPSDLTVLADESLRIPLARIARDYTSRTQASVTLWFASTGSMTSTIREGADVDIVITADDKALKTLEHSGQIDVYATQSIVSSPLVIAVAGGAGDAAFDLLSWRYNDENASRLVVIESPHSLEQRLSEKAFASSELLRDRKAEPVTAANIEQAVATMKSEHIPGLLLAVEVFSRNDVRVVQRFPEAIVSPAIYKAAVLAGDRMVASRNFIRALEGPEASAVFTAYGLSSAP